MKIDNYNIFWPKYNYFYKVFYNLTYEQSNVHYTRYEPMLDHNELLVNGVDYPKQIVGLNKIVEINGRRNKKENGRRYNVA